jgi:hypothetical protein
MKKSRFQIDLENRPREITNGNESLDYGRCSIYFVAHVPSLLHHNNIVIAYGGISNFRMEQVQFVLLYYVAMA